MLGFEWTELFMLLGMVVLIFIIKILASISKSLQVLVKQHQFLTDSFGQIGQDIKNIERHNLNTAKATIYPSSMFMQQRRIEEIVDDAYTRLR